MHERSAVGGKKGGKEEEQFWKVVRPDKPEKEHRIRRAEETKRRKFEKVSGDEADGRKIAKW